MPPKRRLDHSHKELVPYHTGKGTAKKDIAELLNMSLSSVYALAALHRATGSVKQAPKGHRGRPKTIPLHHTNYIADLLTEHPEVYVKQIQSHLLEFLAVLYPMSTLHHTIARLGFTKKKSQKVARQQDEGRREAWWEEMAGIPKECYIWTDETAIVESTASRTEGWARRGVRSVVVEYLLDAQRHTVLPAISLSGVVALDVFEGSCNAEDFCRFIQNEVVSTASSP